jgi:hypothetical protein
MDINQERVEHMVLALLHLTTFKDRGRPKAWKSHDWGVLDRLHAKG